ncbi:MAG: methyltransferase domain-containing protein [Chloroflexales bacterium]
MSAMNSNQDLADLVKSLSWYHTVDLGRGIVTEGAYDHRPYLTHYGFPHDLRGKTVLDIGAASGFFSFEFERLGADVTATELPTWFSHDFGPNYIPDQTNESAQSYLHQPIAVAKEALGSHIQLKYINIYDIHPETIGIFDVVFCGSVLIHLTDPIKALWNIAQVTRDKAMIATVVDQHEATRPIAHMVGHASGYCWWIPTRACLELMAVAAGFVGIEWVSEFQLNYRGQETGPYHGVLHAYKTTENWGKNTLHRDEVLTRYGAVAETAVVDRLQHEIQAQQQELKKLKALVSGYENGRFMRIMRWWHESRRHNRVRPTPPLGD